MDAFAGTMVARGPTLLPDRETATGSLHVVGLPGAAAAREFVAQEPNNRAGVYGEHLVYRFENLLGRTMWEFAAGSGEPKFLIIAHGENGWDLPAAAGRDWLILHGALAEVDDGRPAGAAFAVQARDRDAARALLGAAVGDRAEVEAHDWEFGGPR
jgi:hypothetical protein